MYKITYEYIQPKEQVETDRNMAIREYRRLVDDPKAQNVKLLVTETREMTPDELKAATKDQPFGSKADA